MLSAIMGPLGGGFGYVFHLFFVSPEDIHHPEEAKKNIQNLCIASALVFTSIYVVALLLFRAKPPTPPTYAC